MQGIIFNKSRFLFKTFKHMGFTKLISSHLKNVLIYEVFIVQCKISDTPSFFGVYILLNLPH